MKLVERILAAQSATGILACASTASQTKMFVSRWEREIDAIVARLYDLTEAEFTHILGTFPLVDLVTKQLTLETYRDLLRLGHFPHHNR